MELDFREKGTSLRPAVKPELTWPRINGWRRAKDFFAQRTMALLTAATCFLIVLISLALLYRAWPLISMHSLGELLTSQIWHPLQGAFGFAPFIAGSAAVTLVAMVLSVIPAVLSGIYLAEFTSEKLRRFLKPLLDLLVGIPSVVYGLWGVLFVVPIIREFIGPWTDRTLGLVFPFLRRTNPSGYGLLAAGFVLAIMVFPLIVAVTEEVLRSVPREMREATLSLGATRWETAKCIVRYRGQPGILAAVVLGFSRAFGETLAVMMLVGNAVQFPRSLFDTAYPLPALIANNYGEMMSVPLYESALMGAALLLLLFVLAFNLAARMFIVRLETGRV